MTETVRLAKHLADLTGCSRSEAEQYIAGGWVTVDGNVIEEPGFRVADGDQVTLLPNASLDPVAPVTILLHKPVGCEANGGSNNAIGLITPATLIDNDRSGLRFLKRHVHDLSLAAPLETEASGLVILTQDWRITRKLIEDAPKIEQEYIVEVRGDMVNGGLALLNHGLTFSGKVLAPIKVSWQNETRLRFALKNAQLGQIAHMCNAVGLSVVSMKRIRVGRLPMASLPAGQWRYLIGYERF